MAALRTVVGFPSFKHTPLSIGALLVDLDRAGPFMAAVHTNIKQDSPPLGALGALL